MPTYTGGCHCSFVTFTAKLPHDIYSEEAGVVSCNCSICSTRGYLLVYPANEDLTWHIPIDPTKAASRDSDTEIKRHDVVCQDDTSELPLTPYEFMSLSVTHMFCPRCGTGLGGRPKAHFRDKEKGGLGDIWALNVRLFKDIDISKLKLKQLDGRNFKPKPKTETETETEV